MFDFFERNFGRFFAAAIVLGFLFTGVLIWGIVEVVSWIVNK